MIGCNSGNYTYGYFRDVIKEITTFFTTKPMSILIVLKSKC